MPRIIVVAESATEAEAASQILAASGTEAEALVIEPDPGAQLRARVELHTRELQHVERLATLGTLAAGTAHEVNNMLTHLLAILYDANRTLAWLDQSPDSDASRARLHRDIQSALDACDQLRALTRGMTQYSSSSKTELMDAHLGPLLAEAIQIVSPEVKPGTDIECTIADETPSVRVNPAKICQVFVNLLTNAAHAIAAQTSGQGGIRIATVLEGEDVRIDVADTGCGIEPAIASRVFEPFFTTKRDEAGTGLGLSVSRTIVAEHGGQLRFFSDVGEGTTFSVILPAVGSPKIEARTRSCHRR